MRVALTPSQAVTLHGWLSLHWSDLADNEAITYERCSAVNL